MSKTLEVMELNNGDKIKLTNGDEMIFNKLNRTKFVATMNGQGYTVPINMFASVIEKVDMAKKETEKKNILATLKKGDYFYINKGGNAVTYKFECIEGERIIGVNPIGNGKVRIDINFEIGKL